MKLSALQERLQKNAVIISARQSVFNRISQVYNTYVKIEDISEVVTKGTTPQTYGFGFVPEGIPFLRAEDVLDGELCFERTTLFIDADTNNFMSRSRTCPGDILITIAGTIGRAAVVPETAPELNMNQAVALIRCRQQVNPLYVYHMLQSHDIQQQITESTVTSAISNLSLNRIKGLRIPIPSIEDQNMIAMFLEGVRQRRNDLIDYNPLPNYLKDIPLLISKVALLAAKIEEARGLRNEIQKDLYVLRRSVFLGSTKGKLIPTPMRDLLSLRETDVSVNPEETYHFAGIYSFGKGMFKGQRRTGTEFSYTRLTYLKTNNFVYPKLMAWEGALAIVPSECDGLVVSPEFPVFEVNQDKVLPETLEVYFQSPDVWPLLSGASTGTNVRRKRLNPSDFFAFEMPLPSMETQILLRDVNQRANVIKRYNAEATIELNALLPSILDKAFKGEL